MAPRQESEPRRLGRGGGFSLIETVVVMLIVSILAAVAVVSLSSTTSNRWTMAARQLQSDLGFARQRAVATGTPSWVVFDTAAETWTVMAEDPNNPGKVNASTLDDPATDAPFVQALNTGRFAGVQILSATFDGGDEVGFNWIGQPLDETEGALGAQGSVVLRIDGTDHTVTVEVETGNIAYTPP